MDHGFVDTDICSGNSILWRKKLEYMCINLYWSQHPDPHWTLYINQIDDFESRVDIARLPDDFDFSLLTSPK